VTNFLHFLFFRERLNLTSNRAALRHSIFSVNPLGSPLAGVSALVLNRFKSGTLLQTRLSRKPKISPAPLSIPAVFFPLIL